MLGVLLAIFAVLTVLAVHEIITIGKSAVTPMDLVVVSAATVAVLVCFVTKSNRAKRSLLYVFYVLFTLEIVLQALALAGVLPRVSTYSHVPFGRVYWTKEGHANSTMNRYGWYCKPFTLDAGSRRIVIIGDSMLQGVQVRRDENLGAVLENLLSTATPSAPEVLACGLSGAAPTHYIEILRYAAQHFHPDEVILFIFIGNDFVNIHRDGDLSVDPHDRQLYYFIDDEGTLRLHGGSESMRRGLHRSLEYNHRSLFVNAFRIARSHYLTRGVLLQTIKGITPRQNASLPQEEHQISDELRTIGLDDFIFRKELDASGFEAIEIVTGLLERCHLFAASHGITLRIVTIPVFPSFFFERYRSSNWSLESDEYNFLLPEEILTDFAWESGIEILPLGRYMGESGITVKGIRDLYFHGGRGYFTPAGHRYVAAAVYTTFYAHDSGYARCTSQR
jgi:hypothetical protein